MEGAQYLASVDWPRLVHLEIRDCLIGVEGARALGRGLMPALRELYARGNLLGYEGALAFMEASWDSSLKIYL
jgi:hypothetical protein